VPLESLPFTSEVYTNVSRHTCGCRTHKLHAFHTCGAPQVCACRWLQLFWVAADVATSAICSSAANFGHMHLFIALLQTFYDQAFPPAACNFARNATVVFRWEGSGVLLAGRQADRQVEMQAAGRLCSLF
jgi:hypothetical protein